MLVSEIGVKVSKNVSYAKPCGYANLFGFATCSILSEILPCEWSSSTYPSSGKSHEVLKELKSIIPYTLSQHLHLGFLRSLRFTDSDHSSANVEYGSRIPITEVNKPYLHSTNGAIKEKLNKIQKINTIYALVFDRTPFTLVSRP